MTIEEILFLFLPMIAVSTLLAIVGKIIASYVGKSRKGWRGTWHKTRALHPLLTGFAFGFLDLPVPEQMGHSLSARLIWYSIAGGLAVPIYEMVLSRIKKKD